MSCMKIGISREGPHPHQEINGCRVSACKCSHLCFYSALKTCLGESQLTYGANVLTGESDERCICMSLPPPTCFHGLFSGLEDI